MAYQVFARKYRPQNFADVIGQDHIILTLKNSIKFKRVAHAYIFNGPRGVGKTSVARIYSKALNCLNLQEDFEPCNQCENCISITNSGNIDVIEIDGASNRGIEEVRGIRENIKFPPTSSKYKIYIIDEVHMLTKEAFNALLKTLEEPPGYVIFIFATTQIYKVPETIISRCQRFYFNRIIDTKIIETLNLIINQENIVIDERLLSYIARKSEGGLRDAESLLDQIVSFSGKKIDYDEVIRIFGIVDIEIYFKVIDAILTENYNELYKMVEGILIQGRDFNQFLEDLLEQFHLIILSKTLKNNLIDFRKDLSVESVSKYIAYSEKFSIIQLRKIIAELINSINLAKYSNQLRILVEATLFKIIEIKNSIDVEKILQKLNEFEDYLKENKIPASQEIKTQFESPIEKNDKLSEARSRKNQSEKADISGSDLKTIYAKVLQSIKSENIIYNCLENSTLKNLTDNSATISIDNLNDFKKRYIEENKKIVEDIFEKILNKKISVLIDYSNKNKEDIFEKMVQEKITKIPQEVYENKVVKTILEKFGGEIIKVE